MATGKVKKWLDNKGIGWIIDDADGAEVFFGDRSLRGLRPDDIRPDLAVEFERREGDRGPNARDVRPVGAEVTAAAPRPVKKERNGRDNVPPLLREIPVSKPLRELLRRVPEKQRHPGLQLDKFLTPCPSQEQQRDVLEAVVRNPGYPEILQDLHQRRRHDLSHLGAKLWQRTTNTPLTLHLARAAALENAGLCLHPVYGFAYLPGTGLKGMTHAYACDIWLPSLPDSERQQGWETICHVFGWAPSPWLQQLMKDLETRLETKLSLPKKPDAHAGAVVFHDSWPTTWPKLVVDIVNNHHPKYYQGEDTPGDWDAPNPVYFLAIEPGTSFELALSGRRNDTPVSFLNQAEEWLDGALTHLGCGAKTAAGYGGFQTRYGHSSKCPNRATCEVTLQLVTPAFLAGAGQEQTDCTLRSATLRGLLRWWWRAMHSGFVEVETLRRMEAALWGDTTSGGAIRLTIVPSAEQPRPEQSAYKSMQKNRHGKEMLQFNRSFANQHQIDIVKGRMTQGLVYAAYGMDENTREGRKHRWFAPPGSTWQVQLSARDADYVEYNKKGDVVRTKAVPKEIVLDQAQVALWWFCQLGGAGSKSRKGFGSFADPPEFADFPGGNWRSRGQAFRDACGLPEQDFNPDLAHAPSLHDMRELADAVDMKPWLELYTPWSDPWKVMDEIGAALQAFAQAPAATGHGKHCEQKRHLGLPRKIHGPHKRDDPPPVNLNSIRGDRHASPVWFHVARRPDGLTIRVCAFPSSETRADNVDTETGIQQSRSILERLLRHLREYLSERMSL